jgi:hypothetical protein
VFADGELTHQHFRDNSPNEKSKKDKCQSSVTKLKKFSGTSGLITQPPQKEVPPSVSKARAKKAKTTIKKDQSSQVRKKKGKGKKKHLKKKGLHSDRLADSKPADHLSCESSQAGRNAFKNKSSKSNKQSSSSRTANKGGRKVDNGTEGNSSPPNSGTARCNTVRRKKLFEEERAASGTSILTPKRKFSLSDQKNEDVEKTESPTTVSTKPLSVSTRSKRWSFTSSLLGHSSKSLMKDENESGSNGLKVNNYFQLEKKKSGKNTRPKNSNKRWYVRPDNSEDLSEDRDPNRFVMEMVFFQ